MEKRFDHINEEKKIYESWEKAGYFSPEGCIKAGITEEHAKPFSMVLPPPNVTGVLHMGHAFEDTIQDAITRYHRMKGDRTLWIPGTDHAAIATQAKVEKEMFKKSGKNRHDLGREKFLEEVEKFVKNSHEIITSQLRTLGSSLDWTREAFTLDEKREEAVYTAFKRMYEDNLIYRGDRIVNWCSHCGSTLSNEEVEYKERTAKLYYFKYSPDFPIVIATTRPETKLGDTAVAVNPNDERYKEFVGKEYDADFAGRKLHIKIVADDVVDPEFGTGAVGVTPSHSSIDWDIAERHDLPKITVINEEGKMNSEAGEFEGKTVEEARDGVIEWLKGNNLLEKEEDISQNLSVCYRCSSAIESLPKLQWFVDVDEKFKMGPSRIEGVKEGDEVSLKYLMKKVVENGQIKIIPDRFRKIYLHWIENLKDWCISRQIWYGHRIPVWYKGEEKYVGSEQPEGNGWSQDPDTLDTWFSSGLWTFSTLGWPEETEDLKMYHPNSVIDPGYGILFFWVARMILMSTYLLGEIPFKVVYLHGMVRDKEGRIMSKSLGNGIDPLDMVQEFGADATRFSLIVGVGPGNDINFSEDKTRAYRNFSTKIWNVARFLDMSKPENYDREKAEKMILGEYNKNIEDIQKLKKEITEHYEKFELNLAGEKIYDYLWNTFANKILEDNKGRLRNGTPEEKQAAYFLLETIFFSCLKMIHPLIPFVTEAVYRELGLGDRMLMVEKW